MATPTRKPNPRLPMPEERASFPPVKTGQTNLTSSGASNPSYDAKGTIISVPEGEGATIQGTRHGKISVPGGEAHRQYYRSYSKAPIDIVVYFMDKTGISLSVEDGQNIEAGELFELVMEEMGLPDEGREMFSLWLVSDLLELQLKPNHVPFKLACYWEELLEKYTLASEEDIERDEPVIMFQRNVFYSRAKERRAIEHLTKDQKKDVEMLRLLYHEAKENVVDGRYPVQLEEASQLSGIQALLNYQVYSRDQHTADFYKPLVEDFFSMHFNRKKSIFSKREKLEEHIVSNHRKSFQKFGNLNGNDQQRIAAYKAYLTFCWDLPYYGAAFFRGQVEHPGQPVFRSVNDDPVYIAINTAGVFIIDMDDVEFLMGLLFEKMSWEYAEPADSTNRNCYPCLFFSFVDKVKNDQFRKVLQVFSKEAKLVDALIETCKKLKIERKKLKEDVTDGIQDEDDDGVIEAGEETWKQFNRLCLTTFDRQGKIIDSKARGIKKTM